MLVTCCRMIGRPRHWVTRYELQLLLCCTVAEMRSNVILGCVVWLCTNTRFCSFAYGVLHIWRWWWLLLVLLLLVVLLLDRCNAVSGLVVDHLRNTSLQQFRSRHRRRRREDMGREYPLPSRLGGLGERRKLPPSRGVGEPRRKVDLDLFLMCRHRQI